MEKDNISKAKSYLFSQLLNHVGQEKFDEVLDQESRETNSCGGLDRIILSLASNMIEEDRVGSGLANIVFNRGCPHKIVNEKGQIKILSIRQSGINKRRFPNQAKTWC